MIWPGWDKELLGALDIPATRARLRFLAAWAACEGGSADFNPFNTTYDIAGSTRYNSAGVRNYSDRIEGLAATLLTLRLPFYAHLLAALREPSLSAASIARRSASSLQTWGTNPLCVERRLG